MRKHRAFLLNLGNSCKMALWQPFPTWSTRLTDDRTSRIRTLFYQLIDMPPQERSALLDRECAGDPDLRAELEDLILRDETKEEPAVPPVFDRLRMSEMEKTIGPYKIVKPLGEGGFGEVFIAEQSEPFKRRVAVKIMKAGLETKALLARFDAERQALAILDHPCIARIYDAGETERGRPYFVMELVDGEPITTYCSKQNLSLKDRILLFRQVCLAVQHAHANGIIHRDLKPSNLLVAEVNGKPLPKVIDFGIAKAITGSLTGHTLRTKQTQVMGTLEYMSPEQADTSNSRADTRADVYSLGAVLYEILTGELLFEPIRLRDSNFEEVMRMLREEDPPPPSRRVSSTSNPTAATRRLKSELAGDLDWIVGMALEKDPNRRYESPLALARDLERYLDHEPVQASPPGQIYQLRRFARRHRIDMAIAGSVIFAIVAGAISLTYSYVEANNQRAQTQAALDESEAVTEFLTGMLAAADPRDAGRDVTVFQVIERADNMIERDFAGQAAIRARLHGVVGTTYRALGYLEQADSHLVRALATYDSLGGQYTAGSIASAHALSSLRYNQGRYVENDSILMEILPLAIEMYGEDAKNTLLMKGDLGVSKGTLGQYDEAIVLLQESLSGQERVRGPSDRQTLNTMNQLGLTYRRTGRLEECDSLFRLALERGTAAHGESHPSVLTSLASLAYLAHRRGDHEESESLCRTIAERRQESLGDDHPDTFQGFHNLAFVLRQKEKYEEAERAYRFALEGRRRILGDQHPSTQASVLGLAMVLRETGRLEKALELFREHVRETGSVQKRNDSKYSRALIGLGRALMHAGRMEEALPPLEEAMEVLADMPGQEKAMKSITENIEEINQSLGKK